jgi:hypothetical protein
MTQASAMSMSAEVYFALGTAAFLLLILLAPEVRRLLDGRRAGMPTAAGGIELGALANLSSSAKPSPLQVAFVSLLAAALMAPMFYDLARDKEHWPFSSYPMFSTMRQRDQKLLMLFGVTESGDEINIQANDQYLTPFIHANIRPIINPLLGRDEQRLTEFLSDVLGRYERRRSSGEHDGPALKAMRLYQTSWHKDPAATQPLTLKSRSLLLEVGRSAP